MGQVGFGWGWLWVGAGQVSPDLHQTHPVAIPNVLYMARNQPCMMNWRVTSSIGKRSGRPTKTFGELVRKDVSLLSLKDHGINSVEWDDDETSDPLMEDWQV